MGWFAPLAIIELVRRSDALPRREYTFIWLASLIQWMVVLYGVRIAHPWLNVGWVVLSAYLAVYTVLFVSISRVGIHQLRLPVTLTVPLVWVGLEYARGFMFTGFSLALVGHSQIHWTSLIQVADLFGAYAVSFLMITVCTTALVAWHQRSKLKQVAVPIAVAVALFIATLAYGYFRLAETPPDKDRQLRVALLQGTMDTIFEYNPQRDLATFKQYRDLSLNLAASGQPVDLIVWPESVFVLPEIHINEDDPPKWDVESKKYVLENQTRFEDVRRQLVTRITELYQASNRTKRAPQVIIGTQTRKYARQREFYNAALVVDPAGMLSQRYYKMHPVWFGETIPLGDIFPFLYDLSPMEMGMSVGKEPLNFQVGDIRLCPNICFEITVPHLIRRQFASAKQSDQRPDAFINLTNDGWFWGSSILDFQFASAVFRAVENRCPVLVAANCGITAHIDGDGKVVKQLPRRTIEMILTTMEADGRTTGYHLWGDWPVCGCLLFVVVIGGCGWMRNRDGRGDVAGDSEKKSPASETSD